MSEAKILAFAGSAREGSFHKRLVRAAAVGAERAGASVTYIDLRDYEMPLYDGDLEDVSGLPENAKRLKTVMKEHHGFLIATPEYNSAISPLLKNAIDWASRPEPGEQPLEVYAGKAAGLLAASPGALGGLRGLNSVRTILTNIKVVVVPEQFALSKAHEAFDDEGRFVDPEQAKRAEGVAFALAQLTRRLMHE